VAKQYFDAHIERVTYIHLKSSQDNLPQPVLTENALDFAHVFNLLARHRVRYISIELDAVQNAEEAYQNLEASVDYLKRSGAIVAVEQDSSG
jgi:sugar phosphate isomerase/epimerase